MSRGARTEKQAGILNKYHLPSNVSFEQAGLMIDQLKAQGWKPGGIGVPAQPYTPPTASAPQQQYGAPQQNYGAPAPQYAPPAAPYGAPPQNYGAPAPQYGGPTAAPQYAPPAQGGYQYPPPAAQPAPAGGCTPKQAEILAKYQYPTNVSFDTASQIIEQLKNNNWTRPDGQGAPAAAAPQYAPPAAPPTTPYPGQYGAPAPAAPSFDNGAPGQAPWQGTPQFAGVPNFG